MTDVRSRLVEAAVPDHPEGVVLVLHGGGSRGADVAVSPAQLSVLRMVPVAARVVRAGRGRLAVLRLLNSSRGWSGRPTPVDDVRWALGQVRERFGDLPVALVGHSLGGRVALLGATDPSVRSVVGLATWLSGSEGIGPLPGRSVLLVHGDADRVARIGPARAVAARLGSSARVGFVTVRGGSHSMLRHHGSFDGLAARWVAGTLLGDPTGPVLSRVLDGESEVSV